VFIIPVKWIKYLEARGITDPEDIKSCLDATGIEIRVMYDDSDEHEGYYDSINDAIDALLSLSKLHPQLVK
jgi:hypothetical protein